MSSLCLYGGAPYHSQEFKLKKGVDIVIGTPGRVKVSPLMANFLLKNFQFPINLCTRLLMTGKDIFVDHVVVDLKFCTWCRITLRETTLT